jgi:hypothetical protein
VEIQQQNNNIKTTEEEAEPEIAKIEIAVIHNNLEEENVDIELQEIIGVENEESK